MSGLSRSSPAGQKSARPNHIQLTKVSPSKSYSVDQESAHPDHLKLAKSQPILSVALTAAIGQQSELARLNLDGLALNLLETI